MANAAQLTVNSHYKIPWIVWKRELTVALSGGLDYTTMTIEHGLPFIPLLIGQWSLNSNFYPSYDLAIETPGYTGAGQPPVALLAAATPTLVRLTLDNRLTDRVYVRLMAYAPPGYTGEVIPVEYSSPFRFNSHYRYPKIVASGKGSPNQIINHNLGYIPQAQIWDSSVVNGVETVMPAPGILTTSTLKSTTSASFYYYIFGDKLL